jgi:hypothetical protein
VRYKKTVFLLASLHLATAALCVTIDAPNGEKLVLSLTYKLSPAAELFAFGQWNVGNPQSEFLQLYRLSVISGLHYYWN